MPSGTLTNPEDPVNANLEDVIAWAERSGDRGVLNPTTARLKISALRRFTSVLGEDEKLSAQALLDNLDSLLARYARKEGGGADTLSTYKQRAESLLTDFLDYQRDPLAFQARGAERSKKESERKPERRKSSAGSSSSVTAPLPEVPASPVVRESHRHTFPLDGGRVFAYELPPDGLTFRDVKKLQLHLISLNTDFDLSQQNAMELTRQLRTLGNLEARDE